MVFKLFFSKDLKEGLQKGCGHAFTHNHLYHTLRIKIFLVCLQNVKEQFCFLIKKNKIL